MSAQAESYNLEIPANPERVMAEEIPAFRTDRLKSGRFNPACGGTGRIPQRGTKLLFFVKIEGLRRGSSFIKSHNCFPPFSLIFRVINVIIQVSHIIQIDNIV
jgi:hypothetical protein